MAEKHLAGHIRGSAPGMRVPAAAFVFAVAAFAWLRFSENTVDNDLWGHVLYGQRAWLIGHVERVEVLSWSAAGLPWINHEYWAEIALGLAHRAAGGTGLWLGMLALAAITLFAALREGAGGDEPARRWTALGLFAASVNFIALGYAVRPQLFTLLAFVALLTLLRRFFAGRLRWGPAVPPVFALWVNLHGGYFAGWVVLLLAGGTEGLVLLWPGRACKSGLASSVLGGIAPVCALVAASTAALALNPWGFKLVYWTVQTLRLPRPQITEWQPLLPSPANVPFYLVILFSLLAWVFTRKARRAWEAATLCLLTLMAILHQRHAPLFGLANLMFTPPHLLDAMRRLAPHCQGLLGLFRGRAARLVASVALVVSGLVSLRASLVFPREHPATLEVPRDIFPVSAIEFMRQQALTGNTLTFFDWGQEVLWELPFNPVSFDGRLDTVYSPAIMQAHWLLYANREPGPALDLTRAEVALLPVSSGGVAQLLARGWQAVYRDPLAAILVKDPDHYPQLARLALPVQAGEAAVSGRVPFPDALPLLATPARPR